jgi:hypothetical protein
LVNGWHFFASERFPGAQRGAERLLVEISAFSKSKAIDFDDGLTELPRKLQEDGVYHKIPTLGNGE